MMKESMRAIEGIGDWAAVAFVLFFAVFVIRFIWLFWMNEKFIDKMSHLPLEDGSQDFNSKL